jgi:hypothetical protein
MAVILAVVMGGFVVAGAMGVQPGRRAAAPVVVGGVRLEAQPGWSQVQRIPGDTPAVVLAKGNGSVLVISYRSETDAVTALDRYVAEVLMPEAIDLRISDSGQQVGLPSGGLALRRFYVGTFRDNPATLEGEITGFLLPSGSAVVFDGWAERGSYQRFADEVQRMIDSARPA